MIKKAPTHSKQLFRLKKSSIFQIAVLLIATAILLPQARQFSSSWDYIKDVSAHWVILAGLGMVLTIVFAALVYMSLVPKNLPFRRTLLIQSATYFTNRLLPSGLGGIGFNALYLVKQAKLSRTDAAVYATANNLIGFVAFTICVLFASLVGDSELSLGAPKPIYVLIASIVVTIALLTTLLIKRVQRKIIDFLGHLVGVVLTIIRHPRRLAVSVLFSIGITASYAVVLWASTKSVGIDISVLDLFIAFIAGNAALTVSPTPGGIGAVEAAITAVLVGAGISPPLALASVVLYRVISYWLPIIPGYIAFRRATKYKYV